MTNTSKIFKAAWKAAKEGAAKFGGSSRSYFAEALRQAWKVAGDKVEALKSMSIVKNFKNWKEKRVYITLEAHDNSFAGCRNFQLYIDLATNELVARAVKGRTPRAFDEQVEELQAAF